MNKESEQGQRSAGLATSVRGLGLNDHICIAYDDPDDFRVRLVEFLTDGVALGQRIQYTGSVSNEELRSDLAELEDLDVLIERGVASIRSIGGSSGPGVRLSAVERAAIYASQTREALAAGFTGLRGVAEATSLIRTFEQRNIFANYEHLIERYMTTFPLSAMCAYRRAELGQDPVAEMACLHPMIYEELAPFRLYAKEGGGLALAGEIDFSCDELFDTTLQRTLPLLAGQEIAIDASELSFIDHRGLLTLERHARRLETTLVLRGLTTTVVRVSELLNLSAVRMEEVL